MPPSIYLRMSWPFVVLDGLSEGVPDRSPGLKVLRRGMLVFCPWDITLFLGVDVADDECALFRGMVALAELGAVI